MSVKAYATIWMSLFAHRDVYMCVLYEYFSRAVCTPIINMVCTLYKTSVRGFFCKPTV